MAATEIYDKVSVIEPDVAQTLSISPQGTVTEEGNFLQRVNMGDDGSEERITLATTPIFFVTFDYNILSESDMGTLFDLYFDTAKANGIANSFKWASRGDGHTYVVRFADRFSRGGSRQSLLGSKGIRMRILGKVVDVVVSASVSPSLSPSTSPSASSSPSNSPSVSPSTSPSNSPSLSSSASISPSKSPSESPSNSPSRSPSVSPSVSLSGSPSKSPSESPSESPSSSKSPSESPSESPSASPS